MVIGSLERGSREVNIKSSLKFRNRTADGRGLTDGEKSSWYEVFSRFADEEKQDLDDPSGWELFLSASATGMRHRMASAFSLSGNPANVMPPQSVPKHILRNSTKKNQRVARPGSFLSFGNNRLRLAFMHYTSSLKAGVSLGAVKIDGLFPSRDEPVTRVAPHPFLPAFVSGSSDGHANLWHIGESRATCQFSRYSPTASSPITRLRVSPDGYKVIGADAYGRCTLWQIGFGESYPFLTLTCAPPNRAILDCTYLNLSSVFATCSSDGVISVWDTLLPARSCCVASWYKPIPPPSGLPGGAQHLGLCSLAFSPQTRCLFTGTESGSLYSIDVRQCRTSVEAKTVHQKPIVSLAISPDGYSLGSGSTDGSVKLWSLDDLSPIATIPNLHPFSFNHHQAVTEIQYAPNGALFSCGVDGTVKITYSSEAVI
jgi:hypothetical protein